MTVFALKKEKYTLHKSASKLPNQLVFYEMTDTSTDVFATYITIIKMSLTIHN